MALEARTSQNYVRNYFADIEGPRPLFAINTSLSCSLLGGGALLLVFVVTCARQLHLKTTLFLWAQSAMLAFLSFDDRFQVHERLGKRIGIDDSLIIAAWGVLEAGLLLSLARRVDIPLRSAVYVAIGVVFYAVMLGCDGLLASDMPMRLSIEDLSKSWACAMFFAASWTLARFHLQLDPQARTLADWLAVRGKVTA